MAMCKSLIAQLCTLCKCSFSKTESIPENMLTGLITVTSRRLDCSKGKKSKIKTQLQMLLNVEKNQVMYFVFWVFFPLGKTYLIHLIHKGHPRNTSLCLLYLLNLIGAQIRLGTSELLFANVFCSLLDPLLSSLPPSLTPYPHSPPLAFSLHSKAKDLAGACV